MIFDAKLNSSNDLDFNKNNIVTDIEKTKQQVLVRLKLFRGEWDYNTSIGVPYFQSILGKKNPDLLKIFSLFLTEIEKIPDITSATILDFDFNEVSKQLVIKFSVMSKYGNIVLSHSIS